MGVYDLTRFALPNGLDELGYRYSMSRFQSESLDSFRRRIILESREPAGASQQQFIRSVGRQVGLFDEPVFDIDLILDGSGEPLAADPFIEITSTYLRAYSDYDSGTIDIEVSLIDRDGAYFLRDIEVAFTASTYFDISVVPATTEYQTWLSANLRYDNTERTVVAEGLLASRSNKLNHAHVKSFSADAAVLFQNEVASSALVAETGDFFVDYLNGVVFTNDPANGTVSYSYRNFPYRVFWQPVRPAPVNDSDQKYALYDMLIDDDTGLSDHTLLNSEGAALFNDLLAIHALGWGE